ncbi:hypothetical protein RWV98_07940 [Agathobaculum sp. NTUH-O15-33]|uniref:hypothetical protein n=1 Tax=Agathobaculum sp. NTUH-O15-33 TaxID=3079302 RepID=UPI0029584FC0|nr:hypothetical protein [Agathobaculum sp. NTUH-O15-33]WNX86191.1 hypothetical protein RWV98_07940 [Agathobaculum sp. NTUH-O15-33]
MGKRTWSVLALVFCTAGILWGTYFRSRPLSGILPYAPLTGMTIKIGTAGANFTETELTGFDLDETYRRLQSLKVRRMMPQGSSGSGWYEILLDYSPIEEEPVYLFIAADSLGHWLAINIGEKNTYWKILS